MPQVKSDKKRMVLDSSSLIYLWEQLEEGGHPAEIYFAPFDQGNWYSSRLVLEDLERRDDDLSEFLWQRYPDAFGFPSIEIQECLSEILQNHPRAVDPDNSYPQPDILLVAHAVANNDNLLYSMSRYKSLLFPTEIEKVLKAYSITPKYVEKLKFNGATWA
jgi:hypothetical protein